MNLLFSDGIPQVVAGANRLIMICFFITRDGNVSTKQHITDFSFVNQPLIEHAGKKTGCFTTYTGCLYWVYRVIIVC